MWLERPTTDGSAAPGENGHLPGEAVVDGGLL
jgi:hypothetical protein